MIPINILGAKNFRVFGDNSGFLEELEQINLLTGANNSGKSSIIKILQVIKDNVNQNNFPGTLNLTNQEHLLGDFENILENTDNKKIILELPFIFLGIKTYYISLEYWIPKGRETYVANLRSIEVIDKVEKKIIFSFKYIEASEDEKRIDKENYESEKEAYKQKLDKQKEVKRSINSVDFLSNFFIPPFENSLEGFVNWSVNLEELHKKLKDMLKVYEIYQQNKNSRKWLEEADNICKDAYLSPSHLTTSLKDNVDINLWNDFLESDLFKEKELLGKESVGERDLESEEYFYPAPQIEDILNGTILKVMSEKLKWESSNDDEKYTVLKHAYIESLKILTQRIKSINFLSTIREENLRVYNTQSNSPFTRLIKSCDISELKYSDFINKYLKEFQIGEKISVEYLRKYQLMYVSIIQKDTTKRELVDFGYGIKQLILILIQIEVLRNSNKRIVEDYDDEHGHYFEEIYNPSILIIEEPETNLHPKWQSLLAKLFSEAVNKFNIQFVIETHSEYLIRNFQNLVANQKISEKSIKIFYLRNPTILESNKKQIDSIFIKKDGSIDYELFDSGFFDQNDSLELSLLNIQRNKFFEDFSKLKKNKKDDEDKIIDLQKEIDNYVSQKDLAVYHNFTTQRFDVSKLSPKTIQYLVSGQFLLHNINDVSDFSPVIIQYGRALENELKGIFANANKSKKWMLGVMQAYLEKILLLKSSISNIKINSKECSIVANELALQFKAQKNLKIKLINTIRNERNDAGHAGYTKTKQEALDYIKKVDEFLDAWISEKK